MPGLRIEIGGQTVVAHLQGAIVRVGRDPSCDLHIDDPKVSAVHLTIEPLPTGGYKLVDANSGLPTLVNGVAAKRVALRDGDLIEVGPARITYLGEGVADAPAPAPVVAAPAVPVPVAPVPARAAPVATRAVAPSAPRAAPAATSVREAPAARTVAEASPPPAGAPSAAPPEGAAAPSPVVVPRSSSAARHAAGAKRRLTMVLGGLALFAALAFGIAQMLKSSGGGELDLKSLRLQLDQAKAAAGEGDLDTALPMLDRLAQAPVAGVRIDAAREAAWWRKRIEQAEAEAKDLLAHAAGMDAARAATEYAGFEQKYGAGIARRFPDLATRLTSAATAGRATRLEAAVAESGRLARDASFAAALAVWDRFDAVDAEFDAVEAQRAAVLEAANALYLKVMAQAAATAAGPDGPSAAARFLRERLPTFSGTPLAPALASRASAYDREVHAAGGTRPGPTVPGTGPAPTPAAGPVPSAPTAPSAGAAARAKVEALLADAETKISARRFAEALPVLDQAAEAAAGTADASRVAERKADVASAREGLAALVKAIREQPARFADVELTTRYAARLVEADEEWLTVAVKGGRTKQRWASVEAARLAVIAEAAAGAGASPLPLACLLREAGAKDGAERLLLRAVEGGADKAAADARLARWRGEAVPEGGYVVHAGHLVAPAERDRRILEARIEAACRKVAAKDAPTRKAAYEELLALGAPAKEAATKALRARREAAVAEVAGSKAFSSGRTRQRLLAELESRRAAALALIEDPVAYPYPYTEPEHQGQKEVDRLVDAVREVWSRPFDLVSSWDKEVAASLGLVTEVDDVLGKVEEGYAADLEAVKAAINRAIDVPGMVRDEDAVKTLAYNERVVTTATPEEKDNVRAVNEYRIMMGRFPVKIDERLVRAARGHSIDMRTKGYFSHDSATPGRENPGKRCALQGYSGGVGENIAKGMSTGRAAFDGWFHSSGHHRNMIAKGWTEMGVGRSGGDHWTQNFGGMTGRGLHEPAPLPPPTPDVAPEPEGETPEPGMAGG